MRYPRASREQKNLIFHSQQLNLMEQISTKWHPGKGYQPYKQVKHKQIYIHESAYKCLFYVFNECPSVKSLKGNHH